MGGIEDAAGALAKIEAGRALVQLYTALVFKGPGLIGEIKRGLAAEARRRGVDGGGAARARMAEIAAGRFLREVRAFPPLIFDGSG